MSSKTTLEQTNDFAPHYDEYISKTNWYGPQMLFGLMFEFIKPNENLLDLGIGTGLSSLLFHKIGLCIYGVDGSEEMIKICQQKGFIEDIREADLVNFKSPYGVAEFDHAISVGVFHLIGELTKVFSEVSRSLRKGGVFAFTTSEYKTDNPDNYKQSSIEGIYSKANEDSGILVFQHTEKYILNLLANNNLKLIRRTEFLAYKDENADREYHFTAYLARKTS